MITTEEIENWINYEGGVVYTDNNHFGGIPDIESKLKLDLQQRPNELAACIKFFLDAKERGESIKYFAEIGAASGGTTFTMNHFLKFEDILIVDDNGPDTIYPDIPGHHGPAWIWKQRDKNLKGCTYKEIIGDSADSKVVSEAIEYSKDKKFDIVFIDGLHTYEYVKKDTLNYMPMLREGGYLMFHDVNLPFIEPWMVEMVSTYPHIEKVGRFSYSSPYTPHFSKFTNSNGQDGIGIEVYKVNKIGN